MRGIARRTCSMSLAKSSSDSTLLAQLAMAEPKQLIRTPAASSFAATSSNSASEMSWMFLPPTARASMEDQPRAFVASIWPSIPAAPSSAKPVRYMACVFPCCRNAADSTTKTAERAEKRAGPAGGLRADAGDAIFRAVAGATQNTVLRHETMKKKRLLLFAAAFAVLAALSAAGCCAVDPATDAGSAPPNPFKAQAK